MAALRSLEVEVDTWEAMLEGRERAGIFDTHTRDRARYYAMRLRQARARLPKREVSEEAGRDGGYAMGGVPVSSSLTPVQLDLEEAPR